MTLLIKKTGLHFLIALMFSFACSAQRRKPVQKIYIGASKNVKIISVDSAKTAYLFDKTSLSYEEFKSLTPKQLYIVSKQLYKAERRGGKLAGKGTEKKYNAFIFPRSGKKPTEIKLA